MRYHYFDRVAICEIEWQTNKKLPDQVEVSLVDLGLTYEDAIMFEAVTPQEINLAAEKINVAMENYLFEKFGFHTSGFGWEER